MKIRTFFITFLVPCCLFLLSAQLVSGILSNYEQRTNGILALKLTIMLEPGLAEDKVSTISSEIQKISGNEIDKITPQEELSRFQSKFGVDVMKVLSENPFGTILQTSVGIKDEPSKIKFAVEKIKGVRSSVYPDIVRADILNSFKESSNKYYLLALLLAVSIILTVWMSEYFEVTANSQIIAEKRAAQIPVSRIKSAFNLRSFVKGSLSGFVASIMFMCIRLALDKDFDSHIDKYCIISAIMVVTSTLLVLLMHIIAMNIDINKRK